MINGWILDTYPDYQNNLMISWIRTKNGCERISQRFYPKIYVYSSIENLKELVDVLLSNSGVKSLEFEEKRIMINKEEKRKVLSITIKEYKEMTNIANLIDENGDYQKFQLYNADIRLSQRYLSENGIFPMAHVRVTNKFEVLDEQYSFDYELPELKTVEIEIEIGTYSKIPTFRDPLVGVKINDIILEDKDEKSLLLTLSKTIDSEDTDIVYTKDGDSFLLPYLYHRAKVNYIQKDFNLGRDTNICSKPVQKGKSYFTYGRILYKPPAYTLKGRIHLDKTASFLHSESGLYGLIDLARISGIPVQTISRLSPGTAISAIQINQALRDNVLIIWKKNLAEEFKTAKELFLTDRGGVIYEPVVGIHENVVEIDFASLYPNIMVKHNISPETILCGCCKDSKKFVPFTKYNICEKKIGLIPRVLEPIIERRMMYKKLRNENPKKSLEYEKYNEMQNILKWLLVTCFGYTGYKNARFGKIECHESINAFAREILLDASEIAENLGYHVLHGIIDSLWLERNNFNGHSRNQNRNQKNNHSHEKLCNKISKKIGIPIELEGVYKWIVFLPNKSNGVGALNRYYGLFKNGEMKIRGIDIRKRDTPKFLKHAQQEMLDVFSKANNKSEFMDRIEEAIEVFKSYGEKIKNGECDINDLLFKTRVSKELEGYSQFNNQVAGLMQLRDEGIEVKPGNSLRYVITDHKSKNWETRVKVAELIDGSEEYDKEIYLRHLAKCGESLLSPFGYGQERLEGAFNKVRQVGLDNWI